MARQTVFHRLVRTIWGDWQTNELWQRIVKHSIAVTVALIIAIAPRVVAIYGPNTFLLPMATVFANAGQRTGPMMESLLMLYVGGLLGIGWSLLGLYLSSLVVDTNQPAAYTVRASFFLVSALVHGYVRSKSPRLFVFAFFMLMASALTDLGKAHSVQLTGLYWIAYPPLTAGAVLLVVNLGIFPELSGSYLGSSTITTLVTVINTLEQANY